MTGLEPASIRFAIGSLSHSATHSQLAESSVFETHTRRYALLSRQAPSLSGLLSVLVLPEGFEPSKSETIVLQTTCFGHLYVSILLFLRVHKESNSVLRVWNPLGCHSLERNCTPGRTRTGMSHWTTRLKPVAYFHFRHRSNLDFFFLLSTHRRTRTFTPGF